ncbi:MAG TPA: DUF4349 domain-containing protein [Clostridia bacterium]|jgi:flagellin-like hook-associated protein FlgL|nr:DUF4349 domain-containing protein [Clostridiaceae bacterium]HOA31083.1 DUF4349 domain-containing protein [Clostridia bacterium]HPZ52546.1 DUF4349 domain-containing protein [Clostridia bacterium]
MIKRATLVLLTLLLAVSAAACANSKSTGDYFADEEIIENTTGNSTERKIIVKARYDIETEDLDKTVESFTKQVSELGGYIEYSSIRKDSADFTIRIPVGKLDTFVNFAKDSGRVTYSSQHGKDVTIEYYDTQAELNALRTQEERLLDLLEQAQSLDDILKLEEQLGTIRTKIEKLTTRLNQLNNLVNFATIEVSLEEVDSMETGFGALLTKTFKSSINAALNLVKYAIVVLVWLLPFLIPVVVIIAIVLIIKKIKTKPKN